MLRIYLLKNKRKAQTREEIAVLEGSLLAKNSRQEFLYPVWPPIKAQLKEYFPTVKNVNVWILHEN